MDIVVTGRNVEVPDHFKVHASDKLAKADRYDSKLARVDVELSHENNPRQAKTRQRVELTVRGRGPAVRAEASGESFYIALDAAVDKLNRRLRKLRERRLDRRTSGTGLGEIPVEIPVDEVPEADDHGDEEPDGPGRVVRIKSHPADPISVDDALFQMELVGHDFYLFNDSESGLPSVVYRRKGFDYGLLRLG